MHLYLTQITTTKITTTICQKEISNAKITAKIRERVIQFITIALFFSIKCAQRNTHALKAFNGIEFKTDEKTLSITLNKRELVYIAGAYFFFFLCFVFKASKKKKYELRLILRCRWFFSFSCIFLRFLVPVRYLSVHFMII